MGKYNHFTTWNLVGESRAIPPPRYLDLTPAKQNLKKFRFRFVRDVAAADT